MPRDTSYNKITCHAWHGTQLSTQHPTNTWLEAMKRLLWTPGGTGKGQLKC